MVTLNLVDVFDEKHNDFVKKSDNEEDLSSFYDIRLIFTRDSSKASVSFRFVKEGKSRKKRFDISPQLEKLIPSWIKYGGRTISVYHRTKHGKYINTTKKLFRRVDYRGGVEPPEVFRQQLDEIVNRAYESLFY